MAITEQLPAQDEIISFQKMVAIYEACIRVREISKRLLQMSEDMVLIAVNAGIASTKSEGNRDALSVLAHETGTIARKVREAFGQIQSETSQANHLAKNALVGMQKAKQLDHYRLALAMFHHQDSPQVLRHAVSELGNEITRLFAAILQSLAKMENGLLNAIRQNTKIARITTYFRIEASRDEACEEHFRSIGESLKALYEAADEVTKEMHQIIRFAGQT